MTKDMLVYALELGIINWFEYFKLYRQLEEREQNEAAH